MIGSNSSQVKKVGKYQIIKEIGRGGFGSVYSAFDPDLNIERVLKIPFESIKDDDKALQEARNQAQLKHPNVVQVRSVENIDGKWVIVMDYEKGGSLRERLDKYGPLSIEESVKHIGALASALCEAHKKDIPLLHYDIKPENILFDEKGLVKLTDFGISRRMVKSDRKMTRVIGTIEYMGPEQLEGIEDKRSEIWSLGTVFYEMLTGKVCFEGGNDSQIIKKISQCDFKPIRYLNSNIPESLEKIIKKMLSLNPEQRYQSMDGLIEDVVFFEKHFLEPKGVKVGQSPTSALKTNPSKTSCNSNIKSKKSHLILYLSLMVFSAFVIGILYYTHEQEIINIPIFDRMESLYSQWIGKITKAVQIKESVVPEVVLSSEFLTSVDQQKLELAKIYISNNDHINAYWALDNISRTTGDSQLAEQSLFLKSSLSGLYLDRPQLAISHFREFISRYPAGPYSDKALRFLGMYCLEQKDYKSSLNAFSKLFTEFPDSPEKEEAMLLVKKVSEMMSETSTIKGKNISAYVPFRPAPLLFVLLGVLMLAKIFYVSIGQAGKINNGVPEPFTTGSGLIKSIKGLCFHPDKRKLLLLCMVAEAIAFFLQWYMNTVSQISLINKLEDLKFILSNH